MRYFLRHKVSLVILFILWQMSNVDAAVITSPSGPTPDGNGQSFAPFTNRGDVNGNRYQQVFSADFFGELGELQSISSIAFRQKQPAFGTFISPTVTFSEIMIGLSTTSRNPNTDFPNGLSANLDLNVGSDSVSVFSGPLTLTSSSTARFDYLINFQTPFLYRPGLGNLLLEVIIPATARITTPGSIGYTQLAQYTDGFPSRDGTASATDINLVDGSSIGSNSSTGAVVRFTVTAVPEPSTYVMFAFLAVSTLITTRMTRKEGSKQAS